MKNILQKRYVILLAILIIITGASFFAYGKLAPGKKVHYHAGFVVWKDNKKMDFSDMKYMYMKPCSVNGKDDDTNADNQLEKAHLHDNVGDVVHIERIGAVWKDLFANIKYPLDYSKTEGFINGKKTVNYQFQAIRPDETLVVFIGKNDIEKDLKLAPAKDYIEETGKKSTTCGD